MRFLHFLIAANLCSSLGWAYLYDCLQSLKAKEQFLGFTLNPDYAEQLKNQPAELLKLRDYFEVEVLKSILIYLVYQQEQPFMKWTNKAEIERYLKLNGLNSE